jgi:hypothetical protein
VRQAVIYHQGRSTLLLEEIELENGIPVKGLVVNGAWRWRWDGKECFALDHREKIVNRWSCERVIFREVPADMTGGYNKIFRWADELGPPKSDSGGGQ